MKRPMRFMILAMAIIGGEFCLSGHSLLASAPGAININIRLPQAAMDLSDLDLRDANNQPIRSLSARQKMRQLFISNLNQMLLFNLTPRRRFYLTQINQVWDVVSGWIKRTVGQTSQIINAWIQKKKSLDPVFDWRHATINLENQPSGFSNSRPRNSFQFLVASIISSTVLLR